MLGNAFIYGTTQVVPTLKLLGRHAPEFTALAERWGTVPELGAAVVTATMDTLRDTSRALCRASSADIQRAQSRICRHNSECHYFLPYNLCFDLVYLEYFVRHAMRLTPTAELWFGVSADWLPGAVARTELGSPSNRREIPSSFHTSTARIMTLVVIYA